MISKKSQKFQKYADKKKGTSSLTNCGEQRWYCQVCALMLTSKLQAQEHYFGKRHQNLIKSKDPNFWHLHSHLRGTQHIVSAKKEIISYENLKKLRKPLSSCWKPKLTESSSEIIPPPAGRDNILQTVIKSEKKTFYISDLSIYRTPSGKYYCQSCNITVNSQTQFLQHSESRKHKHKASRGSFKVK